MMISLIWLALPRTEVAHFLASGKVKLPNAYRVLNADGSIPDEGMLNCLRTAAPISAVGWPGKASSSMPEGGLRKISG